jgi:polysaccharide export outer membrane protein
MMEALSTARKSRNAKALALICLAVAAVPAMAADAPAAAAATAASGGPEYRLHPGDRLAISVWKEPEMQREMTIAPDGKVSFPLTGEIQAAGKVVGDVRREIESRLKKFIPEPTVNVSVVNVEGNRVFVIGQVTRPGAYVMNPELNVLQALSLAGGGTAFAKLDGILILRGSGTAQDVKRFRFSQVSEGKNLEQNIVLQSGDVVVVP